MSGDGVALLPFRVRRVPPGALQEVWYYQEQQIHSRRWNPEIRDEQFRPEERVLLVFFAEGRYDGHLWRANREPPQRTAEAGRS